MTPFQDFAHNLREIRTYAPDLADLEPMSTRIKRVYRFISSFEGMFMPRKTQNKKFDVPFGKTWFVRCTFTPAQVTVFDEWLQNNELELPAYFRETVHAGDKVSLSYDLYNDCVIASLTIRDELSPAYGGIITARSTDALRALWMVFYKRWEYLDLDNLEQDGQSASEG